MSGQMRTFSLLVVLILAASANRCISAPPSDDPLADLRAAHPRLLITAEQEQRITGLAKTDPLLARLIQQNHTNALQMMKQSPIRYEIPDGKRLLSQSRKCIERVAALALAYRLSGAQPLAEAAAQEMLIATRFKDWNPRHFLDTAEMTTALAIGYDWLFEVLPPADREQIREAIVRLGLLEGMKVYESGGWWSKGENNWNQVCNGGMILGALAIAEDEPDLARTILQRAIRSIPAGVRVYDPSGAYPEGPGYWQYGTAYTCLTISGLQTALGHDFGISATPGLNQTGWYRIQTIGPSGKYFNYADGSEGARLSSAVFLLSQVYDQETLAWWHRQRLAEQHGGKGALNPSGEDRFFPLEIGWYDPRGEEPTDDELPRDALFRSRQDLVTLRGQWQDPRAVYVGFKGGDNRTNHGHLDIGSFVLDAAGVRWAVDLGSDNYNMPGYFGSQRWTYYRMTNHSHNTLVIGDQLQNSKARSPVIAFQSAADRASGIVDMTEAYQGQATSVQRGIALLDRHAVLVQDEVSAAEGPVRWGMVTRADIDLAGNRATLRQDGQTLRVEILSPANARFAVLSTKPPTEQEHQNSGTRILAATVSPRAEQLLTFAVLLQPEGDHPMVTVSDPQPLKQWPR